VWQQRQVLASAADCMRETVCGKVYARDCVRETASGRLCCAAAQFWPPRTARRTQCAAAPAGRLLPCEHSRGVGELGPLSTDCSLCSLCAFCAAAALDCAPARRPETRINNHRRSLGAPDGHTSPLCGAISSRAPARLSQGEISAGAITITIKGKERAA